MSSKIKKTSSKSRDPTSEAAKSTAKIRKEATIRNASLAAQSRIKEWLGQDDSTSKQIDAPPPNKPKVTPRKRLADPAPAPRPRVSDSTSASNSAPRPASVPVSTIPTHEDEEKLLREVDAILQDNNKPSAKAPHSDSASSVRDDPSSSIRGVQSTRGEVGSPLAALPAAANKLFLETKDTLEKCSNIDVLEKDILLANFSGMYEMVLRLNESRQTLQLMMEKCKQQHAQALLHNEQKHSNDLDELLSKVIKSNITAPVDKILSEVKSLRQIVTFDLVDSMQQTKPEIGLTNSAKIMQELDVLKNKLDKKCEHAQLSSTPTYAEIAGKDRLLKKPSHAVIISSENDAHTSSSILEDVRKVIDARTTGIQVQNVRKAKWQKVVITCKEKADLITIKEKINKSKLRYQVEEAKFKDPLVVIRDVLSYNTDDDILKSLRSQNAHITSDIPEVDYRASVKYRKRARNPLECHVILQVSPVLWQRMTAAGQLHIDMQRRPVYDQSPLLQCTRCLGFGHGRRHCTEVSDLCSHCSGPHLRKDCPLWLADAAPTCRNCLLGKQDKHDHGSFDVKCPVRQRWDTLARASVSYG